jgi:hypothetical protein
VKIDWETMRYEAGNVALMVGMAVLAVGLVGIGYLWIGGV